MKLTDKELAELRKYRNEPDEDNVRYKQIIKKKLLANNKIIYLLHNKELEDEEAEADEYLNVNILPYYLIAPAQSSVQNFICFETAFENVSRGNSVMKIQQIIFYILCHNKDINVAELSSPRHDIIAAEITNMFQGCNDFGTQLKLMSDKPSVTDNDYATRTLIFAQITTNSITNEGRSMNLRSGFRT
jgi:hypothetical protein